MLKRSSGILMPVFSLPSDYGIGTLGKEAYSFIDFLKNAGQTYWQILPLGPTSYGDSPYQCLSSFAGNPYFIDIDMLVSDGLLGKSDVEKLRCDVFGIDYGKIYNSRFTVLKKAARAGLVEYKSEVRRFSEENSGWIYDFALFYALKEHFGMKAWYRWPDDLRMRKEDALNEYREKLNAQIEEIIFIQYLFFKQWNGLRDYAHKSNVKIIGDMPIYVAYDSADVWANPHYFKLNEDGSPRCVAGVPPDAFAADGQLWGNPIYDWEALKQEGYGFWVRRIGAATNFYDVIRIDHFRGIESFWEVPASSKTAKCGHWTKGPGIDFVNMITSWFNCTEFIAEDLGILTPDVEQMLAESGLPGMKVLEFAFEPQKGGSSYLPHKYSENSVCYIGTHDNNTLLGWYKNAKKIEIKFAKEYLSGGDDLCDSVLRAGMRSKAALFITQMQDWLQLGSEARINTPGTASGNWRWRMQKGAATTELAKRISKITKMYNR
ncbi:MAG: 4-alpha-glucanotransferase [Clostridia bacterium]|nr:4-alpha-glucanotransferase [Clostridia bacterium]